MRSELPPPNEEWEPLLYSPSLTDLTKGPFISEFSENLLFASMGVKSGDPLELFEWQKWLLDRIFECKEDGGLRYSSFLLGLPKKNGKSMIASVIALYCLLYSDMGTQIYMAATNKKQAELVYGEVVKQIENNTILRKYFSIKKATGNESIKNVITGAICKPLPMDGDSSDGIGAEIVIADEIHRWNGRRARDFYATLFQGSAHLKSSLLLGITTAGDNLHSSFLGEMYLAREKNINRGIDHPDFDPSSGMIWWGASEEDDITDPKVWSRANPNLPTGILQMDNFVSTFKANMDLGSLDEFKKFRLNMWVDIESTQNFITDTQMEKKKVDFGLEDGENIVLGFDGSAVDDSTVLMGMSLKTGVLSVIGLWEKDEANPQWTVPRAEVNKAIDDAFDRYEVVRMYLDDAYFKTDAELWQEKYTDYNIKDQPTVVPIPQSARRMSEFSDQLRFDMILEEDNPVFWESNDSVKRHFLNAIVDRTTNRVTKRHKHSSDKIDILIASLLANAARYEAIDVIERINKPKKNFFVGLR